MHPDTSTRYGSVSRFLHWLMAAGIIWVLLSATVHALAEDSTLDAFMWPTHKHVGSVLFVLALVRMAWALMQARRRPSAPNALARLGHGALYALMLAIPLIGLLRQHGSGRAFSPLGLPLFQAHEDKVQWMVELGGALHGELGWALLALVIGHVFMAFWHRRKPTEDVLPRMLG
ncbi:MAG: cytochrome b [Pseudomonadota bacterium]|nr:cytochrome b [Pseudomonadota bacterium]